MTSGFVYDGVRRRRPRRPTFSTMLVARKYMREHGLTLVGMTAVACRGDRLNCVDSTGRPVTLKVGS